MSINPRKMELFLKEQLGDISKVLLNVTTFLPIDRNACIYRYARLHRKVTEQLLLIVCGLLRKRRTL